MDKKNSGQLIMAVVFMFGFLFFWETFVASRYAPPKPTPAATASKTETATAATPTASALSTPAKSANGSAPVSNEDVLTVLTNGVSKVSILSRGARVASWQVKERGHWVELVEPEKNRVTSPLETFPELNFAIVEKSDRAATFQATLPNGLIVSKKLSLSIDGPYHDLIVDIKNPTTTKQHAELALPWGNGIDKHLVGEPYDNKDESVVMAETRVVALNSVLRTWTPGFIFKRHIDVSDNGSYSWAGIDNHHFLAAFIADGTKINGVQVIANRVQPPLLLLPLSSDIEPQATQTHSFKLYVGAKTYSELKKSPYNLDRAVDFGFFGLIAKALLAVLNFFERITGNYGWAIVMLTFCIQLVVFPLTRKNLQMSLKMRTLQPQLKSIQEQFKKDPKRLQIETFNLYRKNGLKFMGMEGCFPMLLQLPIFFAFYSTLNVAYELRGAPWIFWIKDLGAHDPYYVLPIIMGAGMLAQQKLTTVTMDPAQARMMMFMPLIFSFMFIHLPAGLVLYWCVNSLTTIVIQLLMGIHKQKPADQPAS